MKMQIPTNPEAIEDFLGGVQVLLDEAGEHELTYCSHSQEQFWYAFNPFKESGCLDYYGHSATLFLRADQIHRYLPAFELTLLEYEINVMMEKMDPDVIQFTVGLISKNGYNLTSDLRHHYSDEIFEHSIEYNDDFILIILSDSHQFLFDLKGAIEGLNMYRKEHES